MLSRWSLLLTLLFVSWLCLIFSDYLSFEFGSGIDRRDRQSCVDSLAVGDCCQGLVSEVRVGLICWTDSRERTSRSEVKACSAIPLVHCFELTNGVADVIGWL